jgi:hypothetical protein
MGWGVGGHFCISQRRGNTDIYQYLVTVCVLVYHFLQRKLSASKEMFELTNYIG